MNKYKIIWANGSAITEGKNLIDACHNLDLTKRRNIQLGMLVQVRENGITSWWDSRQFQKHTNLTNKMEKV